jgi:peptide methionine sulfoxide reductase msrA/msrB
MYKKIILTLLLIFIISCTSGYPMPQEKKEIDESKLKTVVFAGGCFWCIESSMQNQPGVYDAITGYIGGSKEDADYYTVSTGKTDHYEAVLVKYNPDEISFNELVKIFFWQIDPTDPDGQFADRGNEYSTAVFYSNDNEKKIIEDKIKEIDESYMFDMPVVTKVLPIKEFFKAEDEHQDYFIKKSTNYKLYESGSGRKGFIENTYKDAIEYDKMKEEEDKIKQNNEPKKMSSEELKEKLTPIQYHVTQEDGTEIPFENEYWDNKDDGLYVDVVTGKPLFSSLDKYDSGTGWPSFTKPLFDDKVVEKDDSTLGMKRTEVESEDGTHLGHVFDDGPDGGERFCINSASLKFIPKNDLEKEGYSEYLYLFDEVK